MDKKLFNLHYLRGLSALIVVLFHYGFLLPGYAQPYVGFGAIGVDTFFMISGFIIAYATQKPESITSFCTKRFFRLVPVFFVVWAISAFFVYSDYPFKDLIKSLLLFHNDYNYRPAPAYGFNLMGTPWTLTYEVYFYFIFAVSMYLSHKRRIEMATFSIFSIVALLQLYFNHHFSLSSQASAGLYIHSWWQVPLKILSTTVLYEFITGMLLAKFYLSFEGKISRTNALLITVCSFIFLPMAISKINIGNVGLFGCFWVALPLMLITLTLDKANLFFCNSFLNNAGNVSYSLYIVHFPVMIYFTNKIYPSLDLSGSERFLSYAVMISLCYGLSNIMHYLIERPAIKLSRRIINSKKFPYSGA